MTFASEIRRSPLLFDADIAAQTVANWAHLQPEVKEVVAAAASCSPFLTSLIQREAVWLDQALTLSPDDVLPGILAPLDQTPLPNLPSALRQAKRRVALYTGLADLAGVWDLARVTGALTELADTACHTAARALTAAEIARGKLPGQTLDDAATAAGLTVLAMGKMGAAELNYSSDIDLIVLFDQSRFDASDFGEARAAFVRITRKLAAMLGERTADGYVFRTDLRLRPDAGVTPVSLAMEAAERYYESFGRTWERAAHIKARACAGDLQAGADYLGRLRPFVWRRHLDFAAIEEAQGMRQAIHDHKGLYSKELEGRDLKLAAGGIREIEFFTQTRQLISGGRDPSLRVRGTVEGLARLAQAGWVSKGAATELTQAYQEHRRVEHALQMVADAQTHSLPKDADGMTRIARMLGEADTDRFRQGLSDRIARVTELAEDFYGPVAGREAGTGAGTGPGPGSGPSDATPNDPGPQTLAKDDTVARWSSYPSLRSPRAHAIFDRLKPKLLAELAAAPRPDQALAAFDGFLAGLPAGVQLFSLFEANPDLLALIVDIAATAPDLAQYLSRNAGVLDAVLGGGFFAPWPGRDGLSASLMAALFDAQDYEAKLDATRVWCKEWHFRAGVHLLRGLTSAEEAGRQYADLAEATVATLLPIVTEQFSLRHGAPPGRGAMVLAMGNLGTGWMTARSDLDLIVIYDAQGVEASDGPKPLATRAYFARLTQALVTALSAPMAEGRLYEVDMRLRPSGRQGPVATSLQAFDSYQQSEAWTWEHMALTRARAVAGDAGLCADVEAVRSDVLAIPSDPAKVLADMAEMRARLSASQKAPQGLEAKLGAGRMQDIELLGQAASVASGRAERVVARQLALAAELGWIYPSDQDALTQAHARFRALQGTLRLLGAGEPAAGGAALILREMGGKDLDGLQRDLANVANALAQIIEGVLETSGKGAS